MTWYKITIKFAGKCIICKNTVQKGSIGFWKKDVGIKHEKCISIRSITCIICGQLAKCSQCEFNMFCDINASYCLCKQCSDKNNSLAKYQKAFINNNNKISLDNH